jgi:ABC-2 type transport system ATP-binding protein
LTFEHVTKFYGPVIGVNDISCRIGPGITGLFGANGAGKSTLLKLASGQLRPSLGTVHVGGDPAWSSRAKRHFGFSPDINHFYEEMSGREFVYTMALLHGMSRRQARRRTEEVLIQVGMADRAHRKIGGYSHGMRARTKLGQALVHEPSVLLLDEPMSGIDPGGRREINLLLTDLARQGTTILVSSHILVEVEQLTDSIVMIGRGRMVASGRLSEIRELLADQPYTVQLVADPARKLASLLVERPEVCSVEVDDDTVRVRTRQPADFFAFVGQLVLAHAIEVQEMQTLDVGADAVFDYLEQGAA